MGTPAVWGIGAHPQAPHVPLACSPAHLKLSSVVAAIWWPLPYFTCRTSAKSHGMLGPPASREERSRVGSVLASGGRLLATQQRGETAHMQVARLLLYL